METYSVKEPRTFRRNVENFWYYHKWHVLAGILIICIMAVGIHSCVTKERVDLYVLYVVSGSYSTQTNEALAQKLEKYADDVDGDGEKNIQIITVAFSETLSRSDQSQSSELSRFVGQVASGPALLYLFDDANYDAFDEASVDILADISTLGESEYLEHYRYNVRANGFLDDVEGFSATDKTYYFGMRISEGIPEDDSRYPQIAQGESVLRKIIAEYN